MAGRVRIDLALLNFSAWIRRQRWLSAAYRRFPETWREKASAMLADRASARARFPRTSRWELALLDDDKSIGTPASRRALKPDSVCVNIFGYIRGQFGLGESARRYARALINAGADVSLVDVDLGLPHGWDDRSLERWIGDQAPHPVSMIFVNPDYLESALLKIGEARLAGRYLIACWFWELERLPEDWIAALARVDAVMVASEFVERTIRLVSDKPVFRVPMPIADMPDSGLRRSDFGLEDGKFLFLTSFDFNSWIARKNPMAVLQAFFDAFPAEREDVRLLVKSSNGFRYPEKFRHLLNLAASDSRVVVRDDVIPRVHLNALQRCCDAYVSLHRSEGFGLGLAECMLLGKPVIATGWSGNMEFMDDSNSCLVGYRLVDVGKQYPGGEGQRWAEPDAEEAARWMRQLADDPALARRIGCMARSSVSRVLSPDRAAEAMCRHLAGVRDIESSVRRVSESGQGVATL